MDFSSSQQQQDAKPVSAVAYRWSDKNVFHAISENRMPADKLFDRPHYFAILDKLPVTPGHALLITKHKVATMLVDMPPEAAVDTMGDLQVLCRAVQKATGSLGVRVRQNNGPAAGQIVPQLHFHVIPVNKPEDDDLDTRTPLTDEAAGPMLAAIKNALPASYSGPGVHAWIPSAADMESLGHLLLSLCCPGTVLLLSGHLGGGKTAIARGLVRAFCGDPDLFVPSPTFLLNLSYQEDTAHEPASSSGGGSGDAGQQQQQQGDGQQGNAEQQQQANGQQQGEQQDGQRQQQQGGVSGRARGRCVHHMDPYRLGNADKMAGLIDFTSAFQQDICLIEWPSKMPPAVMDLPRRRTIQVTVAGSGARAAGRLVHISCRDEQQQQQQQQSPEGGSNGSSSGGSIQRLLQQWREANKLPEAKPSWRVQQQQQNPDSNADGLNPRPGAAGGLVPPGDPSSWLVLGIESSCDDTAAAVIKGNGTVLSHRIASQVGLHEQYGGVKPDVAQAAHAAAIEATVDGAIADAGITPQQLSAVAVTIGPGLSLCLQVGVRHALKLAAEHQIPWVPVHHMEAHALMAAMPGVLDASTAATVAATAATAAGNCGGTTAATAAGDGSEESAAGAAANGSGGVVGGQQVQQQPQMTFPALLLLVSGGHNMLVRCEGVGRHTVMGTTIDDSMGEAFDKTARLLGINAVPGGAHLERLAAQARPEDVARYKGRVTLPMRQDRTSCNFSFSGIKTAVGVLVAAEKARLQEEGAGQEEHDRMAAAVAALFQDVSVRFLEERTERALQRCAADSKEAGLSPISCIVVAGGVAANSKVRAALTRLAQQYGLPFLAPPPKFCSDNGLMVAWTGLERLKQGLSRAPPPTLAQVESAVEVLPRWPLGPVDVRGMSKANSKHCKMLH